MCKCTPGIKTPFCGKPGCEWPEQREPVPSKEKVVHPWDLVTDKDIQQLVFSYEMILTEMRTHARPARRGSAIREWVQKLDRARDEFVSAMAERPALEPRLQFPNGYAEKRGDDLVIAADGYHARFTIGQWSRMAFDNHTPPPPDLLAVSHLRGIVYHWNEFGPAMCLEEKMHYAHEWLKRHDESTSETKEVDHG